jgi:hypothetical protein
MQWLVAPNSQTHAIVTQVTFFQKWHLANVGESGESSQNVWRMSTSLVSPRKTVWRMLARLVILSYFPKRLFWQIQLLAKFAKFAKP